MDLLRRGAAPSGQCPALQRIHVRGGRLLHGRVFRLFDLRFERYPRRWVTAVLAGALYLNFFTLHYIVDLRWLLLAAALMVLGRSWMHFRFFRLRLRMPLVLSFALVALLIWFVEYIATWSKAWAYPDQLDGWQFVFISKLGSWFLLMIISVVLVTWVDPPQAPDPAQVQPGTLDGIRLEEKPGGQSQDGRNDHQQSEDPR